MQLPQPTGIADVGLQTRHVLGVVRVDQNDLEAVLYRYLLNWDPINARGFYCETGDAVQFEPEDVPKLEPLPYTGGQTRRSFR